MVSAVVGRRGRTEWYVAVILATAVVGSGLVALWGVVARPPDPPKTELTVLPDYDFERRIIVLYEEQHARTVRRYSSRYDTKVGVLRAFANNVDKSKLEACIALTDVLSKGFCPPDLTDPSLGDYKGPWGSKNLNDWVRRIERHEVRASISLAGVERELLRPVDWWILFCGTVEQYEAEAAKKCLGDWNSLSIGMKVIAKGLIYTDPRDFITERSLGSLLDKKTKNLKAYLRDLPNIFCDSHDVYSRRHVDFVRSLYNEWVDAGLNSGPLPDSLERRVERYVRDLLEEREVKVKEIKAVAIRPPADEGSTRLIVVKLR